jgi:hypothetical protein
VENKMMKNMGYGGKMKEKNEARMKYVKSMEKMKSSIAMKPSTEKPMKPSVTKPMKPSVTKPMKPSVTKPSKAIMGFGTKKTVTKLPGKANAKMTKTKIKMF